MADETANGNACRPDLVDRVPAAIQEVWHHLLGAGEAFLVGGAVRDLLLAAGPPKDYDLATNLPPQSVWEHFATAGYHVIPTGIRFGTVTVMARSGDPVEITTYRVEGRYDLHRRPQEVHWGTSILEDLGRRDFTVNAAALGRDGRILLPPGVTLADFSADALLRAVGDPDERLKEDPLRILRAYRFAGRLGRFLDPALAAACRRNAHKVRLLSSERIFQELDRILQVVEVGPLLTRMEEAGVLQAALPEWGACVGFRQNNPHHRLSVSRHMIAVTTAAPLVIRWAALLHDIAKPACFRTDAEGVGHFNRHDEVGAETAGRILTRMAAPAALRERVMTLIRHHLFPWDEAGDAAMRRLLARIGPDAARELILLRAADVAGKGDGTVWTGREQAVRRLEAVIAARPPIGIKDLALDGHDVVAILAEHGMGPGPVVGRILHFLAQRMLEHPEDNTRDRLLVLTSGYIRRHLP